MLNRNSAIKENYKIGKYPFEDKIEIVFSENHNLVIQQIAAWPDEISNVEKLFSDELGVCLLYTSPSPRDKRQSRMPSSA